MELHKSGQMTEIIPARHETGLCKNLLQEYAQKMNYVIPYYKCNRQEERAHPFICNVEIGASNTLVVQPEQRKKQRSKRQAALLAIKDGSNMGTNGASQYTVLPF